ncbi:hypothetical protein DIE12_22435 [Burkholderia sp. Bp9015]|nr:hypothetical protein DIE20_19860 [Burkholderia sp. Bp9131]RQR69986.1 hypothetical protein DIE12_22435 [Burkholderia sp. Bp9015]RQS28767.1 hypothetical protein DIE05_15260 [Burkholderia sp. Bp8995]RQS47132.1 hypothetical protein DIE00_15810 [Burkholderia sp. Bp8989]RQZ51542.1 hypothetical protein DIE17_02380 [Burkholderia sp. Bp9099]
MRFRFYTRALEVQPTSAISESTIGFLLHYFVAEYECSVVALIYVKPNIVRQAVRILPHMLKRLIISGLEFHLIVPIRQQLRRTI